MIGVVSTSICDIHIRKWQRIKYFVSTSSFNEVFLQQPITQQQKCLDMIKAGAYSKILLWYNKRKHLEHCTLLELQSIGKAVGLVNITRIFRRDLIKKIKDFIDAQEETEIAGGC